MKIINFKTGFLSSNIFNNAVIVFGICLSLFTITSFDSMSNDDQLAAKVEYQEQTDASICQLQESKDIDDSSKKENKLKAQHNFIASYLLEESSAKRETKNNETKSNFLGQLLQLHKTILSNAINLL